MSWSDWAREVEVEPSVYAADFRRLGEQVDSLLNAGARVLHVDIGDGHFIPPVTIGSVVVEALHSLVEDTVGRLDCHLMVTNPDKQIPIVAASGADAITFHIETSDDPGATIALAREQGVAVGVTLNPSTPVSSIEPIAADVDLVLLMSVVPGYSGQSFIPESIDRLRTLRALIPESCRVQIDGGIGRDNIALVRDAGADLMVAGSSIFAAPDPAQAYRELVDLIG
ncbi:MAG: ribulose-phosphate 3-epimerase [Gaiellaceae bacterium]